METLRRSQSEMQVRRPTSPQESSEVKKEGSTRRRKASKTRGTNAVSIDNAQNESVNVISLGGDSASTSVTAAAAATTTTTTMPISFIPNLPKASAHARKASGGSVGSPPVTVPLPLDDSPASLSPLSPPAHSPSPSGHESPVVGSPSSSKGSAGKTSGSSRTRSSHHHRRSKSSDAAVSSTTGGGVGSSSTITRERELPVSFEMALATDEKRPRKQTPDEVDEIFLYEQDVVTETADEKEHQDVDAATAMADLEQDLMAAYAVNVTSRASAVQQAHENALALKQLAASVSERGAPPGRKTILVPPKLEMRTFHRFVSAVPIVFTAPHGVSFLDGRPRHPWERHTHDIARALAEQVGGTSIGWSAQRRKDPRKVVPGERDPNFVKRQLLLSNPAKYPMFTALARFRAAVYAERNEHQVQRNMVESTVLDEETANDGGNGDDADNQLIGAGSPASSSGSGGGDGGGSSSSAAINNHVSNDNIDEETQLSQLLPTLLPPAPAVIDEELILLHFDCHGCTDSYDHDLMLGTGAFCDEIACPHERAFRAVCRSILRETLYVFVHSVLEPRGMSVTPPDREPPLTGSLLFDTEVRGGSERMTMTHQSSALGFWSCQLEMSVRLRETLVKDQSFRNEFAQALFSTWRACVQRTRTVY